MKEHSFLMAHNNQVMEHNQVNTSIMDMKCVFGGEETERFLKEVMLG